MATTTFNKYTEPTLFSDHIDAFLKYLKNQRCMTEGSIYNHGLYLRRTELFMKPKKLTEAQRGSEIEAAIWEAAKQRKMKWNGGNMHDGGVGWRNRCAGKVVNYLEWAFRERIIERNPYPQNTFKAPYRPQAGWITEEKLDLIYRCDRMAERDKMMIRFFYDTGFRISEAINVKVNDIDFDENTASAFSIKENRIKCQPITDETKYWIQIILGYRYFRSEWLFADPETGQKSSDVALRKRFRKISEVVGFRIHPHKMRHTIGTHIAKHIGQLQAMKHLGHSTLEMTNHYIHMTPSDLRENQQLLSEKIKEKKNILIGT